MPHIQSMNIDNAADSHEQLLDQINSEFGVTPNMFKATGN